MIAWGNIQRATALTGGRSFSWAEVRKVTDKCIGCKWADVVMIDEDNVPLKVYCLPHLGGCPKPNKPGDRGED